MGDLLVMATTGGELAPYFQRFCKAVWIRWVLKRKSHTQHRSVQIHVLHNCIVTKVIAQVAVTQSDIAPAEPVTDGGKQLPGQI